MPLEPNELETARFGVVAGHVDPQADPLDVDRLADAGGFELLTVRLDVNDLSSVHAYEATGFRLMDTLVYYGRDTTLASASAEPVGAEIRFAGPADVAGVGAVARVAFEGYMGHYHADPRLDDHAADAAYVEWAETATAMAAPDRPVLVAREGDTVLGFLTLRDVGSPTAEIVLNGVHPDHQGRGLYGALVERALAVADDAGTQHVVISTQINNYGVQRVWARLGFVHERSLYTLHKWFDRG